MATKKKSKPSVKSSVKRRTLNQKLNQGTAKKSAGDPFNDQDKQRRLGNFMTAGEHSRVGGRKGIVGQTTKKFRTHNRKSK